MGGSELWVVMIHEFKPWQRLTPASVRPSFTGAAVTVR
ncbi:hypothetical protein BRAS3843_2880013 [Bradyrhizobium sp. STM 3843]|nr:hypothetical protein BRAS3843_2880013 [Bradyrhizobium sp. STM 3843]